MNQILFYIVQIQIRKAGIFEGVTLSNYKGFFFNSNCIGAHLFQMIRMARFFVFGKTSIKMLCEQGIAIQ